MYLKTLKLTNFRKFKNLDVEFNSGLNVLIGENDSGKTAIVDAVKYLLNTKSYEQVRFDIKDFYQSDGKREDSFEVIGVFAGFKKEEAANFLEWGYFHENEFELRVFLKATLKENRIIWDLKAGPENAESQMDGNARDLLKVTYLKPLRDAETELSPGYRSRLAQILLSHRDFIKTKEENEQKHELEEIISEANKEIKDYIDRVQTNSETEENIIDKIQSYMIAFLAKNDKRAKNTAIEIASPELHRILRSLSLKLEENSSGLGAMNKLFMAAELLHLETDPTNSLRLCLIEELEAHLHPQAQLRVIKALQNIENTQFILTTHSTTIGSSIPLDSLILCKNNSEGLPDVFPMWKGKTKLHEGDYRFLQRFLDSTKANLFFAKGVILVEGDAENILIPTIAEIIGKPLHRHGVSIVNVGSTAFLRYAKIFFRQDEKKLNLPVAVITDLDVRDVEYYNKYRVLENSDDLPGDYDYTKILNKKYLTKSMLIDGLLNEDQTMRMDQKKQIWDHSKECDITSDVKDELRAPLDNLRLMRKSRLEEKFSQDSVKAFVSKKWTLEYDLALSENLRDYLHQAICLAGKIKSKDEFFENLYVDGHFDISEQAKEITLPEGTDNEIAYKIFEPLLKGNASKAVTAQIFAEILQSKKHQVIDILPEDEYLKYIIDAINYVCTEEENES